MSVGSINFQYNSSAIQYIRGVQNSNLLLNGNFTIEFYIKCGETSLGNNLLSLIFAQYSTWGGISNNYFIHIDNQGGLGSIIILEYSQGPVLRGTIPVNNNVWNHIAIVRNGMGSNNISLFINGILDVTTTNTTPWDYSGENGFTIGNNTLDPNYTRLAYEGLISNLRIVNNVTSIYSDNLNAFTNITFTGTQFQSGLALAYSADLLNWTKGGFNAIHVVDTANLAGSTTNTPNCAIMFFRDNLITQSSAVINSNNLGTQYIVNFKAGPANYAGNTSQATTANDGLIVEILRTNDTILQSYTYYPGEWAGFPTLTTTSFNYAGDGTGNIRVRIKTLFSSVDRFGGCVDDIMISTNDTPIYTSNFTPSKTNLTAIPGTALLLNTAFVSPFLDSSTNNITITPYNSPTPSVESPFSSAPCFLENSKILTDKGYRPIQDLKKGDFVKTLNNGLVPINMIGKREILHSHLNNRDKNGLYKCVQEKYPEVFEDLIITGCHSILVDNFLNQEQHDKTIDILGKIYITGSKYRLPACLDERTSLYEKEGIFTIYHIALDNENYYSNYGIFANGLLVESCSKRYLKELSNMELI